MSLNQINPELNVVTQQRQHIRIAILDLYNNEPNEGMRCVQQILNGFPLEAHQTFSYKIYDVRFRHEVPDMDYDIYISTGGPGSPLEEPGARWEKYYFNWLEDLMAYNQHEEVKKHAFFICHSFQLLCRYLGLGEVCRRHSKAFGIFPVHKTEEGKKELLFKNLPDPFYIVDSRDWQFIQPNYSKLADMGAKILAIEKERPHVTYERAVMAIRFSEEMIGTQFHPEADAEGMMHYMLRPDKKAHVIHHHGEDKYNEMVNHLDDPDKIVLTQQTMLPGFLKNAIDNMAMPVKKKQKVATR